MKRFFHIETVYAHCDIPCGIYDARPSEIAAETVLKMVQKIQEIAGSEEYKAGDPTATSNFIRCVLVKEEHARKCKEEILILWTDFFKPEDLEKYPDLHNKIWKTAKMLSKEKQEVNLENTKQLVADVRSIGEMVKSVQEARSKK